VLTCRSLPDGGVAVWLWSFVISPLWVVYQYEYFYRSKNISKKNDRFSYIERLI
jgi:hypothetical protein